MARLNEQWNLRWNPFRGLSEDEWSVVTNVNVDPLKEFLGIGKALQFIGSMGRGKSTHLKVLHRHYPSAGFVYLHDRAQDPKPLPIIPTTTICFIDESQRMGFMSRFRHFRPWRCLILATHRDHREELERRGFEVKTIDIHQRDPNQIKLILERRIFYSRRNLGAIPVLQNVFFDDLYRRYGDDLRGMENELYEVYMEIESSFNQGKLVWSECYG